MGFTNKDRGTITYVPFYGGAKGQTLQIIEFPDGTVTTKIIKNNEISIKEEKSDSSETDEYQQSEFSKEISAIHRTAQNIIKLQAEAKNKGQLTEDEQESYNHQMEQLNVATRNLALFQQMRNDEDVEDDDEVSRANLRFWFEQKKKKFFGKQSEENKEEENKEEEQENNEENEDTDDGVAINLPPEDASVAEAKPVGLAVAGIGGVASSKPIATAVVGPGGLAIARPVATAIAGVNPEDTMIPVLADGYIKFPDRNKNKPIKESEKENCEKDEKCDKEKGDKEKGEKGNKKKEEKPKQDDWTNLSLRSSDY